MSEEATTTESSTESSSETSDQSQHQSNSNQEETSAQSDDHKASNPRYLEWRLNGNGGEKEWSHDDPDNWKALDHETQSAMNTDYTPTSREYDSGDHGDTKKYRNQTEDDKGRNIGFKEIPGNKKPTFQTAATDHDIETIEGKVAQSMKDAGVAQEKISFLDHLANIGNVFKNAFGLTLGYITVQSHNKVTSKGLKKGDQVVVYLHDKGGNGGTFQKAIEQTAEDGKKALAPTRKTNISLEEAGKYLGEYVKKIAEKTGVPVQLVGHGRGGVEILYAKEHDANTIKYTGRSIASSAPRNGISKSDSKLHRIIARTRSESDTGTDVGKHNAARANQSTRYDTLNEVMTKNAVVTAKSAYSGMGNNSIVKGKGHSSGVGTDSEVNAHRLQLLRGEHLEGGTHYFRRN